MPLDALCLMPLAEEIRRGAEGARIDKIQQPGKNELIFSLRGSGASLRLLISASSGRARAHFTRAQFENPQSPPMFCMLLRKHLSGARICAVTQPPMERVLDFELDTFDEMGAASKKRLIVELIGNSANVILVSSEGLIIDCLRRVEGDMSEKRPVLPGLYYRLPAASEKINPLLVGSEDVCGLWEKANEGKTFEGWLLDTFFGFSPLVCRELSMLVFGETGLHISEIPAENRASAPGRLMALLERFRNGDFTPVMLKDSGKPFDFSCIPISQYGDRLQSVSFKSFSEMLDAFYTERELQESARQRSQSLIKTVKGLRDRLLKKLTNQREELKATQGRERFREIGDIITANLYRMRPGMESLTASDFYSPDGGEVEIKLDPRRTPQQNAAKYYKDYTRAKKAEQHLNEQIRLGETELSYLESVLDELTRAQGERDIAEIRQELQSLGYIKSAAGKKEKPVRSKPLCFTSSSGFPIRVGRNNTQNDELTFRMSERYDIWLHTQKIHGSHVVISARGLEVDERTIEEAAALAAYYSQASGSQKVPVDYTFIKYLKKPPGSKPGMVVYTDYKTVLATPDVKLVESLKDKE